MSNQSLNYCGIAALFGRATADELTDRKTPCGVDMDFDADLEAMSARVAERSTQEAKCAACPDQCPEVVGRDDEVTQLQLHSVTKTL